MRILVVEDEPTASEYLQKGLRENGFVVDAAADGEEALHNLQLGDGEGFVVKPASKPGMSGGSSYDIIILDIMLPKVDGWRVVEIIRRRGSMVPILLLTARDSVNDRVRGLDLGADDYLIKPFAFSELLARVRNLLRRAPIRREALLKVGDLTMDLARRRATRGSRVLDLTPKEFVLLAFLAEEAGNVVSRTLISEHVWDMNFDPGTNVVDVHIRRLRAKVDDPFQQKLIHTIRNVGYVLEARDGGGSEGAA